jgi:hypothetical protein
MMQAREVRDAAKDTVRFMFAGDCEQLSLGDIRSYRARL